MVDAAASPAEAAAVAREGEELLADTDVCAQCSMSFRMAAANAYSRAGDVERARRHVDEAARISEMWQGGPWPAAVREAEGNLQLALGNRARAKAEYATAAELFDHAERHSDAARCRAAARHS
jgi:tetratricopeptide (TPR) repeat protein